MKGTDCDFYNSHIHTGNCKNWERVISQFSVAPAQGCCSPDPFAAQLAQGDHQIYAVLSNSFGWLYYAYLGSSEADGAIYNAHGQNGDGSADDVFSSAVPGVTIGNKNGVIGVWAPNNYFDANNDAFNNTPGNNNGHGAVVDDLKFIPLNSGDNQADGSSGGNSLWDRIGNFFDRGDFTDFVGRNSFIGHQFNKFDMSMYQNNDEFYKWEGPEGFKNYGWPTMMRTWGVLGTAVSGGAFATWTGTAAWGTGETIWNGVSLVNGGINTFNLGNNITAYGGIGMDAKDALGGNPLSIANLLIFGADYYMKNKR